MDLELLKGHWNNTPFPSSKNSHFQNEAKCETFVVKMSFICIIIKNHFHINGFALSLALKVRFFGTRKWPIERGSLLYISTNCAHLFPILYLKWRTCDQQECERALAAWQWDFVQRKANKPKSLIITARKRSSSC